MQHININELKPHPRNNEFFDDITGEKWTEFLKSIETSGVIEPIVVTRDMVIVSGHQRVRACKELGIDTVLCDMKFYKDEDSILKDLLETNIRQRGDVGGSAKKIGCRIKELERLYGVRDGSAGGTGANQYTNELEPKKSVEAFTQQQLAEKLGISVDTLQNYKLLAEMIPEIEELMDTGIVTKTTALAMMRNLSEDEQREMISSMDITKKITKDKFEQYLKEKREYNSENKNNQSTEELEKTKEQLKNYKSDYKYLQSQYDEKVSEVNDLKNQINQMKSTEPTEQYNKKLKDSTIFFCSKVADFIEKTGGYVWLTEHLNELPDYERKSYISAVNAVYTWSSTLLNNINN